MPDNSEPPISSEQESSKRVSPAGETGQSMPDGRSPFDETVTPRDLKVQIAEQRLTVDWKDGRRSTYSLALLRRLCPCATCRTERESQTGFGNPPGQGGHSAKSSPTADSSRPAGGAGSTRAAPAGVLSSLPVLKADPTGLRVTSARLVGNYAIQFFWSDGHYTGIYDFRFLRSLDSKPESLS